MLNYSVAELRLSINYWLRKGSAPALANPNKSIAKIQEPLAQ